MTTDLQLATRLPSDLDDVRRKKSDVKSLLDPEWRYTRARELSSAGVEYFGEHEDPWVIFLTTYLREWATSDEEKRNELEYEYPDIHWAFQIYTTEKRGPRYHIEALVTADVPADELADYLDFPVAVIIAYEACFFDLRRHLDKKGAVQAYITARCKERGLKDLDPDPFWKRIAISEGRTFLNTLWGDGMMETNEKNRFDDLLAAQARRNATEAMRVREINSFNAHEIIEEYLALAKNETERLRVEQEEGAGEGGGVEFVTSLLKAIQFTVATVDDDSQTGYLEMNAAVAQAPALLKRLQGASLEEADVNNEKSEQ